MGSTETGLVAFLLSFFLLVLGYCFYANMKSIKSGEYDKFEKTRKAKRGGERWEAEG
jgi:hypothetical protein